MAITDYVKAVGLDLAEGESSGYVECPECHEAGKFSVTRTSTGLLYHCFRDACPTAGHVSAEGLARRKEKHKQLENAGLRPYTHPIRALEIWEYARFIAKYDIPRETIKRKGCFRWAQRDECYVFPIFAPTGFERGFVLRHYDGRKAKASTRLHTAGPSLSWYVRGEERTPRNADRLVLVEDQISALKLSKYHTTVALLGTSLSPEGVLEISSMKPGRVIIALDEDASNSAYNLRKLYGLLWPKCEVVKLKKDIKDMNYSEIEGLFDAD